ncbi:hypothetical protein Clacol_009459 [Clathrus columnatus]|uniref:DUF6533 domain-containing protein n=1 Tax=Clathrus columnatus TaxID=1419009 RepID=A0AAV5ANW5_9AGAM|nr:hypothetical protein Clacol_009459 [Clathrus columnatus]
MDNSTDDMMAEVNEFIQEVNDATMILYAQLVCLTIAVYHILLFLNDEIRLVWSKKYNFTTVAYLFTRYSVPIQFILEIMLALWPQAATSLSTCNSLANGSNALQAIFLIGVRSLLSMRAYAISRTKWLAIILLGSTFLADIITFIVLIILFPGCLSLESTSGRGYGPVLIIGIAQEVLSIVTDTTSSMIFGLVSTL